VQFRRMKQAFGIRDGKGCSHSVSGLPGILSVVDMSIISPPLSCSFPFLRNDHLKHKGVQLYLPCLPLL
jgi:hypothetical protein